MATIPVLIALAAGGAAALMFASIASGALFSLVLFYLAPLPLMVAGLGWGPFAALIGGVIGCIGIGVSFGFSYIAAFGLSIALPAWWLSRLALLGRPLDAVSGSAPPAIEWYPVGRLVLWAAGFAVLTTLGALVTLGADEATITATLKRGLMRVMGLVPDEEIAADTELVLDALVALAPAAGATIAMMTLTLNLWLGARIARTSGRLTRPWPDLRDIELPSMTLAVLALAVALGFTGGLVGILAQVVAAVLLTAYALVGFATLHVLTSRAASRVLWLSLAYAGVAVFGWPAILAIGLGLTDAVTGLRRRYRQSHPPSGAPPT
ncbi:MAG: hypothetical protein DCC74_02890 [Proteobacteria bacterium]|nr:MAG: hypothetical protein DCC74_02890 [Pseudomonadota bacterium]